MSRVVKNLPASVLDRLRNKAKEWERPFNWVLQYYVCERFLYRLSQSVHRKKFVLKGGLMFIGWGIPLRRHTKDIDLSVFVSNNIDEIVQVIHDVCVQPVEDDAIEYLTETIKAEAIVEEAEYPGIRVRLWTKIGERTREPIQIDMGFMDKITPTAITVTYPTILEMPAPQLLGYPKETVVAEKLHSIVYRGSITSRRKDFYDLWFISHQFDFDGKLLQKAIANTFKNRKTQVPTDTPVALSDAYAEMNEQQWQAFLNTFNPDNYDVKNFESVIGTIRDFLVPVMKALTERVLFDLSWRAGGPWV